MHSWGSTLVEATLGGLQSRGLHFGGPEFRVTDFGSGHAFIGGLHPGGLGFGGLHSEGPYLGGPEFRATDFEFGLSTLREPMLSGSTLWWATLWGSRVSGHRFWIWSCTQWGSTLRGATLWGSTPILDLVRHLTLVKKVYKGSFNVDFV